VVGEAGILVDPHDQESIVDAVCRVLCDGSLREHLRLAGLKRARSFTWEATAKGTLAVYQDLAA
jgi:glycosyltransferase involved in cell wall biosynthesis